jgi:hypothetical protein
MVLLRLVTFSFVAIAFASCSSTNADPVEACGAFFDARTAVLTRCGQALPLDPGEGARQRTRFLAACKLTTDEPGTGTTADWLNSCAASLTTDLCSNFQIDPACATATGTIESGQPCASNAQCQTGICGGPGSGGSCGTCSPVLRTGEACFPGGPPCNASAVCEEGTCTGIARGEVGASCDDGQRDCKSGVCESRDHVCVLPLLAGRPCLTGPDCADGLTCSGFVCTPTVAEGAPCAIEVGTMPSPAPCPPSLVCARSTKTCLAVHVAKAGEACDLDATRCELGTCNGVCPQILADGAPCDPTSAASTCDFYAECKDGKCVTGSFTSCK